MDPKTHRRESHEHGPAAITHSNPRAVTERRERLTPHPALAGACPFVHDDRCVPGSAQMGTAFPGPAASAPIPKRVASQRSAEGMRTLAVLFSVACLFP